MWEKYLLYINAFALFTTGCVGMNTVYEPASYRFAGYRQCTARAVHTPPNDKIILESAHGEFVGKMYIDGNSYANEDSLLNRASLHIAEVGGTHYIVDSWGAERKNDTFRGTTIGSSRFPRATLSAYRVAPENWNLLPSVLRPKRSTHSMSQQHKKATQT